MFDHLNQEFGRYTRLAETSYAMGIDYAKYLIVTMVLLHSGAIVGLFSLIGNVSENGSIGLLPVFSSTLQYLFRGLFLALASAFAAFFFFSAMYEHSMSLADRVAKGEDISESEQPSTDKANWSWWICVGSGIGSVVCLFLAARNTLQLDQGPCIAVQDFGDLFSCANSLLQDKIAP